MASDDNNEIHRHIRQHMESKSTPELQVIYTENDQQEYTEATFEIIGQILDARGASRDHVEAVEEDANDHSKEASELREFGSVVQSANGGFWGDYFSFRKMISVGYIKFMHALGVVAITCGSGLFLVRSVQEEDIGLFISALLCFFFGNLAWRLACEGGIVFFRIYEVLGSIDKKTKQ